MNKIRAIILSLCVLIGGAGITVTAAAPASAYSVSTCQVWTSWGGIYHTWTYRYHSWWERNVQGKRDGWYKWDYYYGNVSPGQVDYKFIRYCRLNLIGVDTLLWYVL